METPEVFSNDGKNQRRLFRWLDILAPLFVVFKAVVGFAELLSPRAKLLKRWLLLTAFQLTTGEATRVPTIHMHSILLSFNLIPVFKSFSFIPNSINLLIWWYSKDVIEQWTYHIWKSRCHFSKPPGPSRWKCQMARVDVKVFYYNSKSNCRRSITAGLFVILVNFLQD